MTLFCRGPLTLAAPADAAVRGLLMSMAAAIRTDSFGFAVLEVDYVRALGTERRWHWLFTLQPGF